MANSEQFEKPHGPAISGGPATTLLDDLRPGSKGRVHSVCTSCHIRRRLLEMGFVPGTDLRVVRVAPMGDPMQVELHGYHLSLRRSEARAILVQPA